ncbi:MAG: hypothetical protein VKJ64_04135 [Leptolyngbyaceae bacterium]|nr:hypothetical protein [Leptolyngbyaceae bacterium]
MAGKSDRFLCEIWRSPSRLGNERSPLVFCWNVIAFEGKKISRVIIPISEISQI